MAITLQAEDCVLNSLGLGDPVQPTDDFEICFLAHSNGPVLKVMDPGRHLQLQDVFFELELLQQFAAYLCSRYHLLFAKGFGDPIAC